MRSRDGRSLLVRVGELEIDEEKREIRTSRGRVAAQPKVFDLLVYLLRTRDRVVTREELRHALWRDTVGPDSITRALAEVRRIVGEELVRTYPRRGVRFVGTAIDLDRSTEPAMPELEGREDVLGMIDAAVARAACGRGGFRIVIGAPGTGKTAVLGVAEQRARQAGFEVRRATATDLARVVEEAVARRTPTLVVHDDLYRAAAPALVDAHQLALIVSDAPIVVLVTCCTSRRRDPRVGAVLAAATREDPDAVVSIGGLDRAALGRLAERLMGRTVSPAALAKLDALTGGNPRFACHLVHLAKQADRPLETLDALPASFADRLRDLVLDQVSAVDPGVRALLDAVSIFDQPFTLALAADVAGAERTTIADALAEAAELGLMVEDATGWRFAHELVRIIIVHALAPSKRAAYHAQAAAALERLLGTPPSHLPRIARHYAAGSTIAPTQHALDVVRRAAQLARDAQRFGVSAHWLAVAIDIEARLAPPSPARRRSLWLEYGKALSRNGDVERAAEAFMIAGAHAPGATLEGAAMHAAFDAIAPVLPQIIDHFYRLLFERHPGIRWMFTRAAPLQRRMFGEAIAALADHVDDAGWLHAHLDALGRRHAEYGVTEEMYGWACAAFLDAMRITLAPHHLADDVIATWRRTLESITQIMVAASRTVDGPRLAPARERARRASS